MANRIARKEAEQVGTVLKAYIIASGLAPKINTRLVFNAWDEASGAGRFTVKRFFRSGKLYVTLNSSVVRSQLMFQKDIILEKINARLDTESLFVKEQPDTGMVTEIILR